MTDPVETPFTDAVTPATPVEPVAPVAPVITAPVQDPAPAPAFVVPESVQGLVGEGKKYATPQDALQALPHAQGHIEKLEQEMANLREDLAKRKAMEDVLEQINKPPVQADPVPQDPAQLDALIDQHMQAKEQKAQEANNIKSVVDSMTTKFGDVTKANEAYMNKARELEMSLEELNSMCAKKPKAAFQLFGLVSGEHSPTKIQSNINTAAQPFQVQEPQKPVSVMGQSTHKRDIDAWKAAAVSQ